MDEKREKLKEASDLLEVYENLSVMKKTLSQEKTSLEEKRIDLSISRKHLRLFQMNHCNSLSKLNLTTKIHEIDELLNQLDERIIANNSLYDDLSRELNNVNNMFLELVGC